MPLTPFARTLLRFLSPAVWGILFCLVMIIAGLADMEKSQGWSMIIVMIFLPALLILMLLTLVLRLFFRLSNRKLWITELVAVLLTAIVYTLFIF